MNHCMNLQFYMVVENGVEGMVISAMGCPRRAVCPSCSSETGTWNWYKCPAIHLCRQHWPYSCLYLKLRQICNYTMTFCLWFHFSILMFSCQVTTPCLKSREHCPNTTEGMNVPWCRLLPWRPPNPMSITQVHHCQAHILVRLSSHHCSPRLPAQSPLLSSLPEIPTQLYS